MSSYEQPDQETLDDMVINDDFEEGKIESNEAADDDKGNANEGDPKGEGDGNGPSEGEGEENGTQSKDEPTEVTVNGVKYKPDELAQIVTDYNNNKDWRKTNTDNAMSIANQAKAMKDIGKQLKAITGSNDAMEILEDMGLIIDKGSLDSLDEILADAEKQVGKGDPAATGELAELKEQIADLKFSNELQTFASQDEDHTKAIGSKEGMDKFLKFITDTGIGDLNSAFEQFTLKSRLDSTQQQLDKAMGKKVVKKTPVGKGAKDIKQDDGFKPVPKDFGYDAARKATEKLFSES